MVASYSYSPIARTFYLFRRTLAETGAVSARQIRPDTLLEDVLPPELRRPVWQDLKKKGFKPPELGLSAKDQWSILWITARAAASLALYFGRLGWLLAAVPIAALLSRFWRSRATAIPFGIKTVGELVVYLTSFRDHRQSGYRWTTSEIELKVRLIIAEQLNTPLESIQPETTWAELDCC